MISIDPDFSGGGIISIGSNCSKIGFFENTIPIAFFFGSSARSHGEATTKRRSSTALQITSASKYNLNSPYI